MSAKDYTIAQVADVLEGMADNRRCLCSLLYESCEICNPTGPYGTLRRKMLRFVAALRGQPDPFASPTLEQYGQTVPCRRDKPKVPIIKPSMEGVPWMPNGKPLEYEDVHK